MKRLSMRAALRCEMAHNARCRCRCGGLLHGARRQAEFDPWFFEGLPEDDPHHARAPRQPKAQRPLPLLEGAV
jgi:hypothetical protein